MILSQNGYLYFMPFAHILSELNIWANCRENPTKNVEQRLKYCINSCDIDIEFNEKLNASAHRLGEHIVAKCRELPSKNVGHIDPAL